MAVSFLLASVKAISVGIYELRQRQLENLRVRSGIRGVLQDLPVEAGQRLAQGTVLARVARPDKLRAKLRIAETQTKDVAIGQAAMIDTRNVVLPGHVSRIDPAVQQGSVLVDVALDVDELPPGVRIDLSVDGTIELECVDETVFVQRRRTVRRSRRSGRSSRRHRPTCGHGVHRRHDIHQPGLVAAVTVLVSWPRPAIESGRAPPGPLPAPSWRSGARRPRRATDDEPAARLVGVAGKSYTRREPAPVLGPDREVVDVKTHNSTRGA